MTPRAVPIRRLPRLGSDLVRIYGWRGICRRATHELKTRSGYAKQRVPLHPVSPERSFAVPHAFDLDAIRKSYERLEAESIRGLVREEAETLLGGSLSFFSGEKIEVGWPPRWLVNPRSLAVYDSARHWSEIPDLDPELGDIKYVWEPSRFGFVYLLARAYALTEDDRYPQAFWEALGSWSGQNPVNGGPNWRCGQETAIRAMALLFGLFAFADHPSSTQDRLDLAGGLLRASGRRIAATLAYALSQRNNHAVSELVGLWTLGALFPGWSESRGWTRTAERGFREVLDDQFYEDGGYAQPSPNYQRLALHNLMWLLAIEGLTDRRLAFPVSEAIHRSVRLLHGLQDEETGRLPNLGSNDGTLLLPLSTCDFRDYRPTLQAASLLTTGGRLYEPGPWDEEAIWLCGDRLEAAGAPPDGRPSRLSAPQAGYHVTRGPDSFVVLRTAGRRRHRPNHADNLHVDVWIGGINVASDPGSYRYNAQPPWDRRPLAATRVHNTGCADDLDQMTRLGPFLWVEWTDAQLLAATSGPAGDVLVAEGRLLPPSRGSGTHRRALIRLGDDYLVYDRLESDRGRVLSIHWNLPVEGEAAMAGEEWRMESPGCAVRVFAFQETELHETAGRMEDAPLGWVSPTYGVLEPVRSLCAISRGTIAHFRTRLGVEGASEQEVPEEAVLSLLATNRERVQEAAEALVASDQREAT